MWLTSVFIFQVSLAERDDSSFEWKSSDLSSATTAKNKTKTKQINIEYTRPLQKGLRVPIIRVVDVEQPVEAHVDTQWDVDQVRVALLQSLIQAGQAGNQLRDVQKLLVLFQAVLVEHLACQRHAQQVHCEDKERGYCCSIYRSEGPSTIARPKTWSAGAAGLGITKLSLYSSLSVTGIHQWWGKKRRFSSEKCLLKMMAIESTWQMSGKGVWNNPLPQLQLYR